MIYLLCVILNFALAQNVVTDQNVIDISLTSQKFSLIEHFFKEDSPYSEMDNKEFRQLLILQSDQVLALFSPPDGSAENMVLVEFNSIAQYNLNVSDGSLRIDPNLIEQIREFYPDFKQISLRALNRFSQLKIEDFEVESELKDYFANLKTTIAKQRGPTFDSYLPSNPLAATKLQLIRISLFAEGFVTNNTWAQLPQHVEGSASDYVVQLGQMGEFRVVIENQIVPYYSINGTVHLPLPKIKHLVNLSSGKNLSCRQLLVLATQ